jgi:hypothetical protein
MIFLDNSELQITVYKESIDNLIEKNKNPDYKEKYLKVNR